MKTERPDDAEAREKRAEELLKTVNKVLGGQPQQPHNIRDAINERAEKAPALPSIPLKKKTKK